MAREEWPMKVCQCSCLASVTCFLVLVVKNHRDFSFDECKIKNCPTDVRGA